MLRRQSGADLPPALPAILAAIDASLNAARLVPVLRRAMAACHKHRRPLPREIDHIVKIIALHAFLGPLPTFLRRIRDKETARGGSKISRRAAWRAHQHMDIRVFESYTDIFPGFSAIEAAHHTAMLDAEINHFGIFRIDVDMTNVALVWWLRKVPL